MVGDHLGESLRRRTFVTDRFRQRLLRGGDLVGRRVGLERHLILEDERALDAVDSNLLGLRTALRLDGGGGADSDDDGGGWAAGERDDEGGGADDLDRSFAVLDFGDAVEL